MSVTVQDVEHVAALARLSFTPDEKERLVRQLNRILDFMEKLKKLDTTKVEPLSHVIELSSVFREDTVEPSYPPEEILKNAPDRTEKFFKVPKVIR
jgi:aspartyl-tRNA(Asn)/glutamyl-tRNA(Gln) amidotransferase subunit C